MKKTPMLFQMELHERYLRFLILKCLLYFSGCFPAPAILCQFLPQRGQAVGDDLVFLVHRQRLAGAGQPAERQLTLPEPPKAAVAF